MKYKKLLFAPVVFLIILVLPLYCFAQKAQKASKAAVVVEAKPVAETLKESIEKSLRSALLENTKLSQENAEMKKKFTELENYARTISVMNNMLKNDNQRFTDQAGELQDSKSRVSELEKQVEALSKQKKEMEGKIKNDTVILQQLDADNKGLKVSLDNNTLQKENLEYKKRAEKAEQASAEALEQMSAALKEKQALLRETGALHYNLGYMFFQIRDYKRAAAEFIRSVELDPGNDAAYFNLGIIYDDFLEDNKTAILYYKKYLDALPAIARNANNQTRNKVVAKMLQAELREKTRIDSPIDQTLR
jgi:tetratricopeptide (TPR) repeat protein